MQTVASRLTTTLVFSGSLLALGASSGCDSNDSATDAPLSEEAKKADVDMQAAMKEFMMSKNRPKRQVEAKAPPKSAGETKDQPKSPPP